MAQERNIVQLVDRLRLDAAKVTFVPVEKSLACHGFCCCKSADLASQRSTHLP